MSEQPSPGTLPVEYPASDGRPTAETEVHFEDLIDLVLTIRAWLDDPEGHHVSGNQFWYWVQGDPSQSFCPDVYVVQGRGQLPRRRVWKVWEEDGAVPALIVELTSRSTRHTDLGAKRGLYEQLGVLEYVMFDPLGEYLSPPLRMWTLAGDAYVERTGKLVSEVLRGAVLEAHGERLRLRAPGGPLLPGPREWNARADHEAQRADAEAQRADTEAEARAHAESRLAEALAELERLRGG